VALIAQNDDGQARSEAGAAEVVIEITLSQKIHHLEHCVGGGLPRCRAQLKMLVTTGRVRIGRFR